LSKTRLRSEGGIKSPLARSVEVKRGSGLWLWADALHDDAEREYTYGPPKDLPDTKVGTFSQEMYDMAVKRGRIIVGMKSDWSRISSFEK